MDVGKKRHEWCVHRYVWGKKKIVILFVTYISFANLYASVVHPSKPGKTNNRHFVNLELVCARALHQLRIHKTMLA
jgi:hypothetical protein